MSEGTATLVLDPPASLEGRLTPAQDHQSRVLVVLGTVGAAEWRRSCEAVGLGDADRRAVVLDGDPAETDTPHDVIARVHPADLTGLGLRIEDAADWLGDGRLLFETLSPLVVANDRERVFRFLHLITRRARRAGFDTRAYLDPTAHDERTTAVVSQAFGSVER